MRNDVAEGWRGSGVRPVVLPGGGGMAEHVRYGHAQVVVYPRRALCEVDAGALLAALGLAPPVAEGGAGACWRQALCARYGAAVVEHVTGSAAASPRNGT